MNRLEAITIFRTRSDSERAKTFRFCFQVHVETALAKPGHDFPKTCYHHTWQYFIEFRAGKFGKLALLIIFDLLLVHVAKPCCDSKVIFCKILRSLNYKLLLEMLCLVLKFVYLN